MANPIPFALSRVRMEHKKANAINTTEIKHPTKIIINPTAFGALINNGIPAPIKKAKTIEALKPKNKLCQILFRLIG
jgi:hypothetical protein